MDTLLHRRRFIAGGLFVLLGGGFSFIGSGYRMGGPSDMGPGFLPFWLGLVLAGLGVLSMVGSWLAAPDATPLRVEGKQLVLIIASVLAFAFLLIPVGLIGAVLVMTVVASLASDEFRWTSSLGTALVLAAMAVLIFSQALGLPIPLLPEALATWRL